MLAQAEQTAPIIGSWVIAAVVLLQLATMTMQLVRWNQVAKREVSPQPLKVEGTIEFTPRKLFDQLSEQNRNEHENLFAKVGGVERGIRAEMKKDTDTLHDKINMVGREVSQHSAVLELQNQRLAQIDTKLDRLIERRPM